jgi:hypothetical protein
MRAAAGARAYALDEIVDATRHAETGQKTGTVVLRIAEAAPGGQPGSRTSPRSGSAGVTAAAPSTASSPLRP